MNFYPAGTPGVLVSIYDTRVRDYRAYQEDTRDFSWQGPGFRQTPDCPAVNITWEQAQRFCLWLTRKEHALGILDENQSYRLPTESEWTAAAASETTFPWGETWPPPAGFANYGVPGADSFPNTSPVGSFPANKFGLYDMSGNVWQMCEDPSGKKEGNSMLYVTKGGSWGTADADSLKCNFRRFINPHKADNTVGFRCVLVTH
jgi:formylglycine-generating enzyme required for sulfatase activity